MSPALAIPVPEGTFPSHDTASYDSEVVEVALLLPRWQALALVATAQQRGMSAGQMLRRMVGAAVGAQPTTR